MFKKILIFLIIFFVYFVHPSNLFAQTDYETTSNTEYKVLESGIALVTSTISIKNTKSNFYPKTYILNLDSVNPQNVKVYETGRKLKVSTKLLNNITTLEINFESASIGKGVQKTFVVTYQTDSLVKKSGEVWEISVPKVVNADFYSDYKISLTTPDVWGNAAYISPTPKEVKQTADRYIFIFDKDSVVEGQILAGFGKFQAFNFDLKYIIENSGKTVQTKDIALPPDTSTQTVFYHSIEPKPINIYLDSDGNWIATYKLNKKQKIEVQVKGSAQIYASPRTLEYKSDKPINSLLMPTSYWQSDDEKIKKIAYDLKTPKAIYDYTVNTLKYDYTRISPNYERLGAKAILDSPDKALCMEFTDLFIALSRAAGIPAREINGFAYSKDTKAEPLSLVSDVLHAWPEYWNDKDKTWVPVDPTWGSTTGGSDFFDKLDLNHLAFVIHGQSSILPYSVGSYKLGGNPEKDISVTFGQISGNKFPVINTTFKTTSLFPLLNKKVKITVENTGISAMYNSELNITAFPGKSEKTLINVIPPFSSYSKEINIHYGFFASASPDYIQVKVAGSEIQIPTNKTQAIIFQFLFIFILLIMVLFAFRFGHKFQLIKSRNEGSI